MTHTKNWLSKIFPHFHATLLAGVICICCTITAYAQNDTIILKNKDRLIGEIKEMDRGVLTIKTEYSDSDFKVKWPDVNQLSSPQVFLVILKDGSRINSTVQVDSINGGRVVLYNVDKKQYLYNIPNDVIFLKSTKKGFISKLDASLSAGVNLTQNKNLKQFSIRSSIGYTSNLWSLQGNYNTLKSSQDESEDISRTDAGLDLKLFFKKEYFANVSADILKNDEQQLDLRLTTKAGLGKYLVHTNRLYFSTVVGIALNNEKYYSQLNNDRNSTEVYGGIELNMFDIRDFSLLTTAVVYPSLTVEDRVRSDIKLDLTYNLPLDFFIKMGFTYNYDRRPPEGANKESYVFQATFGWEL